MNQYTIVNINPLDNSIDLSLEYKGNQKDFTLYLNSLIDAQSVTDSCDEVYKEYVKEIDTTPVVDVEVLSVIGLVRTQLDISKK